MSGRTPFRAPPALGSGFGAVVSQGTAAGGSLVFQVLAARALGASGFGSFTIVMALLVLMAALVGGWVGETRTVLDRSDAGVRGALTGFQLVFTALAAIVAVVVAWTSDLTNLPGALLFGLLSALWVTEDLARRLLATRLEFWGVVVNDVVYLAGALVALAAITAMTGTESLNTFLGAMAAGAAASVIVACFQLPAEELAPGRPDRPGVTSVATFGSGRSAHAGLRPLATVLLRTFIVGFSSAAALGRLEAARLAISPALLVINGLGSFLLPLYSRRRSEDPDHLPRVGRLTLVLAAGVALYGTALVALSTSVIPFLTGDSLSVDRWALAGWSLFAAAFAVGIPTGSALLARRQSWLVFRVRALDSGVGMALAVVFVIAFTTSAAPFGLAAGAGMGALLLWVSARRFPAIETARGV